MYVFVFVNVCACVCMCVYIYIGCAKKNCPCLANQYMKTIHIFAFCFRFFNGAELNFYGPKFHAFWFHTFKDISINICVTKRPQNVLKVVKKGISKGFLTPLQQIWAMRYSKRAHFYNCHLIKSIYAKYYNVIFIGSLPVSCFVMSCLKYCQHI